MGSRRSKTLSLLVLACYALSLTASGWFHEHHHSLCGQLDFSCAASLHDAAFGGQCSSGLEHSNHAGSAARSGGGEPRLIEDGHCLVCQFLSQRTVENGRIEAIACARLVERVVLPEPVLVAHTPVACCQIRAPPSAA